MKSDRRGNYDLLRIICTIAVILIYVSSSYKNAYLNINEFGKSYRNNSLNCLDKIKRIIRGK